MIQLDLSTALCIYLSCNVVAILLLWVFYGYRKREVVFKEDKEYVWHCSICAQTYIDSRDEHVSRCPQCGSYNSKGKDAAADQDVSRI